MSSSNSKSESSNSAANQYASRDKVFGKQKGYLSDIYSQAQGAFNNFNPNALNSEYDTLNKSLGDIQQKNQGAWDAQLAGGAKDSALSSAIQSSMQSPTSTGKMYENIVGGAGNTYIDPLVKSMKAGQMDNLERQMPNLDMSAVSAGQAGSSRHGIAEGLMRSDANKQMLDSENQMRAGAYDTDMNWKMKIAQQADLGRGQAQDRGINMLNMQNDASRFGLQNQREMQDLAGYQLQNRQGQGNQIWDQLNKYKSGVGAPLVLGQSSGSGNMSGESKSSGHSGSLKS